MATFFLSFMIIALSLAGLGLGALMGRGRLRGGCGQQAVGEDGTCACDDGEREKAAP